MNPLPRFSTVRRSPRVRPLEMTPVILRCKDGRRFPTTLKCVSLTGGLLSSSALLPNGARVNLMFVTVRGPVTATAEMLPAVSWTEQPFRFADLPGDCERRLRAVIYLNLA